MRDTLEMAREAGLEITVDPTETPLRTFVEGWDDQLKAFEAIVRADERAASVQEPVARQYQGRDGVWNDFISEKHYKDTLADGSWPIRNLYTDPPAQPAVPLTDEQVDSATKAWFENDIVAGRNPFRKRMRAAFAAAHGITKGQK